MSASSPTTKPICSAKATGCRRGRRWARARRSDGQRRVLVSPSGRRTRAKSRWWVTSISGTAARESPVKPGRERTVGDVRARPCSGRALQVRDCSRGGSRDRQGGPVRAAIERPPDTASVTASRSATCVAGRDVDVRAAGARNGAQRADVDLRGARRIVAPEPIEGFRSLTWRELAAELVPYVVRMGFTHIELHAGDGASVRRIVGLSGHRLLRADEPASARPTTSARSSTRATRPASA